MPASMKPEVSKTNTLPTLNKINCMKWIGILEQTRRSTMDDIEKIKTNAENIEKDRRANEEKQKRDRGTKIQNEVIQSHKKNVEIDWNWQELEEKEDCKELAEVRLSLSL